MSYAYEVFGIKETRHDIWMQDLLLAGTAGATFNSDRMYEIAASSFVKDNGFAGYYMLLWCKYNNVPISDIFRLGQRVAIQNNDYGTVDDYILIGLDSNSAHFASSTFIGYMPVLEPNSTHHDGDMNNTLIAKWLKAETPNWSDSIVPTISGLGAIVAEYGYAHGLPEEFKDILKSNTSSSKVVYPVVADTPYYFHNTWMPLGVKNVFGNTSIYLAKRMKVTDPKVKIGAHSWGTVVPASNTESNSYPTRCPFWSETTYFIGSLEDVNTNQVTNMNNDVKTSLPETSFPSMTSFSTPQFAVFSVNF